jgi:hypothetical protein
MTASKRPKSRGGRWFVYASFGVLVGYLLISLFGSILVSLYGNPPAHGASEDAFLRRQRSWCLTTLTGLRDDLDAQLRLELNHPDPKREPLARFHSWDEQWHSTLDDANGRCHDVDPEFGRAYEQLAALHSTYVTGLTQIADGRLSLSRAFDETVDSIKRKR